jgi:hypothetical protein
LVSARAFGLVLLALVAIVPAACATYQALRYPCLSREPGLRGEVMRRVDGTNLWFNGECWTTKFVTPTDTPF